MNSCIDISVGRIGDILNIGSERLGERMSIRTERNGKAMDIKAERVCEMLSFGSERHGEPMSFRCGLVCTVGSDFYLRVPQESIWLLPENDFSQDVVVYANVSWTIE